MQSGMTSAAGTHCPIALHPPLIGKPQTWPVPQSAPAVHPEDEAAQLPRCAMGAGA
jgi:hypothetical protein